jgi:hypothetical protein
MLCPTIFFFQTAQGLLTCLMLWPVIFN